MWTQLEKELTASCSAGWLTALSHHPWVAAPLSVRGSMCGTLISYCVFLKLFFFFQDCSVFPHPRAMWARCVVFTLMLIGASKYLQIICEFDI